MKITELSAWQKKQKEYLEKAWKSGWNRGNWKAKKQKKTKTFRKETASVSEEESDERKESEEEDESEAEEDPEAKVMEKVREEEEDDPTVGGAKSFREAREKSSFFKGLKTKKPKKEPTVAKRHIYRALPVIGIADCRPSLNLLFKSLVHRKWLNFQGTKRLISNSLYESRIKEEDYTLTTFLHKSVYEQHEKRPVRGSKQVHMHYHPQWPLKSMSWNTK